MFPRAMGSDRVASVAAFARATQSYWTGVFPRVCRELGHWRERALAIPDPALRVQALQALAKRGNMEGAAAFATFAPRGSRGSVVRAAVAFQSAYNYLDTLSEQPSPAPLANSRRLHEALLAALASPPSSAMGGPCAGDERGPREGRDLREGRGLRQGWGFREGRGPCEGWGPRAGWGLREGEPCAPHPDYYEHHHSDRRGRGDGGYLAALVDACRGALRELPSYPAVAPAARRAAERVVSFQAFNTGEAHGDRAAMERWGREQTPPGTGLRWWETAASGGSSLGVHVMIAAAAQQAIEPGQVDALERAYFPWIGALHSMLDHLVDIAEDERTGQRNLIDCYACTAEAAQRMSLLAERALGCARTLPPPHRHELIVAAMASFYLSAPEADEGEAAPVTRAVLEAFGPLARPALAIFSARRRLKVAQRPASPAKRPASPESLPVTLWHVLSMLGSCYERHPSQERSARIARSTACPRTP